MTINASIPIVIDNGSYECRGGFANAAMPSVQCRNIVSKPRTKQGNILVGSACINEHRLRNSYKSAFDQNLPTQFDLIEVVFDHVFAILNVTPEAVTHPLVINEPLCCPAACRSQMSELLFETYCAPKVAYYVDSLAAYYSIAASQPQVLLADGIIASFGYQTTHLMPIRKTLIDPSISFASQKIAYLPAACRRLSVGGAHVSWQLQQLLSLKYQCHNERFTTTCIEEFVHDNCRVAENYRQSMKLWCSGDSAKECAVRITLPYAEASHMRAHDVAERKRTQILRLQEARRQSQSHHVQEKRHLTVSNREKSHQRLDERHTKVQRLDAHASETSTSLNPKPSFELNHKYIDQVSKENASALAGGPSNVQISDTTESNRRGRIQRSAELLVSQAVPAAVLAQMTVATSDDGLTESKLLKRKLLMHELESTMSDDFLSWLMYIRQRRQRIVKDRTVRMSKVDLATELGLGATDDGLADLDRPSKGKTSKKSTPSQRHADREYTGASVVGSANGRSLTERRRRQLEKLRAMTAELKPDREKTPRRGAVESRWNRHSVMSERSPRGRGYAKKAPPNLTSWGDPFHSGETLRPNSASGEVRESPNDWLDESFAEVDESGPPEDPLADFKDTDGTEVMEVSVGSGLATRELLPDDGDESENERDQLAVMDSLLTLYDPEFAKELGTSELKIGLDKFYELHLSTELMRAPEVLFECSLYGSSQAGVGECLEWVLRDARKVVAELDPPSSAWLPRQVFLTGGPAQLRGMQDRIKFELQKLLPYEAERTLTVIIPDKPSLAAWQGAQQWAMQAVEADCGFINRNQYDECGSDYLMENCISNRFYGSTHQLPLNPNLPLGRGRPSTMNRK